MDTDPSGNKFPPLSNDCILKTALGEKTEFVPVWIMRQAGRYLPEFRELRKEHPFFEICEAPELACEVTLMPIKRFNLDAAIIFSDILVIPQALGMTVEMGPEGPRFPHPLKQDELFKLNTNVDISKRLNYVYRAITITRHALEGRCPLIGFSGAPWTLMCYMIEGGGSKTMSKAKKWLYQNPKLSHELLDLIATKVAAHLVEQAKAGAQLLQIFESNAEYLTLDLFKEFAYPYITRICLQVKQRLKRIGLEKKVPIIFFPKGGHYVLELLGQHEGLIDVLSLDWTIDPKVVRKFTNMCLQGNLDPCALYSTPDQIVPMAEKMIESFGTQKYIANLGHGIYPDANIDCVKSLVDSIHDISKKHNASMN